MDAALVPSARVWDAGGPLPPPPPPPSDPRFPAGLRVLVVDDDITCLTILKKMLVKCQYHVMVCSEAKTALSILREKCCIDIVLSDVHMPDMDGFKLLEQIGLEMDLPVLMMSADDGKDVVMKGITHGACDYLIKPVSMDSLKNIWQHLVRKQKHELKELDNSGSAEESEKQKRSVDDGENESSPNTGIWNNSKKRKEEEEEVEEREETSTMKKPRVVWSVELHQQFVTAVNQLGIDKAVPKKILEMMNVPGLTRENVASHLQKYRLYLRRLSVPQSQVRVETPFPGATDPPYGSIINGYEPPSQLHLPQDQMSLHSAARRSANTFADMSIGDHMAPFNHDAQIINSTRMRPAPGQQLNQQMDMLFGPSISVDPRQFGQSHHMVQLYGNMGLQVSEGMSGFPSLPSSLRANSSLAGTTPNGHVSNSLVPRTQQGQPFLLSQQQNQMQNGMLRHPPLRGPSINGNGCELASRISLTGHHMHNGISSHVLGRGRNTTDGDILLPGAYTDTSYGIPSGLPAGSFSLMNSSGAPGLPSSDTVQESASTNLKGLKDFTPHYDVYNDAHGESAQQLGAKQRNIDFGSSFSSHQDFSSSSKDGSRSTTCTVRKKIVSITAEIEREKVECVSQHNGTVLMENSIRLKTESMPDASGRDILFADNNIPDELFGVLGRQQGVGQVEDYHFDGYPL